MIYSNDDYNTNVCMEIDDNYNAYDDVFHLYFVNNRATYIHSYSYMIHVLLNGYSLKLNAFLKTTNGGDHSNFYFSIVVCQYIATFAFHSLYILA